jgi:hypothetical protein
MRLSKIEEVHNYLSDFNYVWWPFLFLKPQPHERISFKRTLIMAPCFALYFLAAAILKDFLRGNAIELSQSIEYFVKGTLVFFFWFNLVTAPLWNRRAQRLQGEHI